ncbi:Pharynx and intestine in excess protein 1 [Trebouxia sp. C0010 RCD-2024]
MPRKKSLRKVTHGPTEQKPLAMHNSKVAHRQGEVRSTVTDVAARSTSGTEGTSDQAADRSFRRTREQAAAGNRTLRSGAAIASSDEAHQLMTLDASGKPVPLARLAPARVRNGSSSSPSMPSQKHRSSTSANKSTAASAKPGSTSKACKDRPAPIAIPSGQDQADSSRSPSHIPLPPASNPATQSQPGAARSEGNAQASTAPSAPDTASKPNLAPVLKSSRGHAPAKVGSPRSARQPGSPTDRKTRAGAESRRMLEEAAAAADKVRQEDAIIGRANQIYERRNTKQMPAFPEPKRGKAHWDHMLEEMNWMAKEFSKERKWKIAQAKRFAKLVSKSNLDVEGRERSRRKEELLNLKKRAAWIAKEAMQFWRKAERVVHYKQQVVSNARKKEVMDKHLDFLVGQTQRYSTLLAQRLAGEESKAQQALPAPLLSSSSPLALLEQPEANQAQTAMGVPQTEEEEGRRNRDAAAAATDEEEARQNRDAAPAATADKAGPLTFQSADILDDGSQEGEERHVRADDSSMEYAGDLNVSDDEATLEEEEALSKAEGGNKGELNSLEAEADMPLEQLLAQYGYVMGGAADPPSADDTPGPSLTQTRQRETSEHGVSLSEQPAKRRKTSEGNALSSKDSGNQLHSAAQASPAPHSVTQHPSESGSESEADSGSADLRDLLDDAEADHTAEAGTHSKGWASANTPKVEPPDPVEDMDELDSGHSESEDFDSAAGSDAGEDDEQTLEEEERMAGAEGAPQSALELADLEDEANMPLEQLLAQYGYTNNPDAAGPSHTASSPPHPAPQFPHLPDPSPPQVAASTHSRANDSSQQTKQKGSFPSDKGKAVAGAPGQPLGDLLSANMGVARAGTGEGVAQVRPEEQAEQAAAAGMDAFEHSQALAERRASGSQAEPSAPPAPGPRGRGRRITHKAQLAEEVAAAAPLAISVPAAGAAAHPALPDPTPLPAASPAQGKEALAPVLQQPSSALQGPAGKGQKEPGGGPADPSPSAGKASKGPRKEAGDKAVDGKAQLEDVAKLANELQPTGSTLSTMQVHTKVPFLLKHGLREYQHIGLDWLMTIYTRRLNGILADEMGLGKTIMTIALLAHLACEKGDWGPHLIVVPTSVMLNWEMEFKKWCPAFKLLTYFGSAKERKVKRHGWSKPNAFHICITSYTLVLQDAKMFRRKKWKYLILDEAHMIKNWKSQRWQTLLNFNSKRRLLITGTPLQNDLMELWSLMHFLMPQIFASHAQFKDWFHNPLLGMVEGQQEVNKGIVERLHSVLRPFLLRRLKCDVEKQLPQKKEHVIRCRLSKRQRTLYEDYMASSDTSATLASSNFLGIINVLMQLRKVCNHPDLFEGRPIVSSFDMWGIDFHLPSLALHALVPSKWGALNLGAINADLLAQEHDGAWAAQTRQGLMARSELIAGQLGSVEDYMEEVDQSLQDFLGFAPSKQAMAVVQTSVQAHAEQLQRATASRLQHAAALTAQRCAAAPLYGRGLRQAVTIEDPVMHIHLIAAQPNRHLDFSHSIAAAVRTAAQRAKDTEDTLKQFMFVIPQARAPPLSAWCSHPDQSVVLEAARQAQLVQQEWFRSSASLRTAIVRRQLFFPDRRLLQFDCGKLQELAQLLYQLKAGGHKALIFTQMTKMLDVLEAFLNLHGYTYLRLDGTTKPEQRQASPALCPAPLSNLILMQRFNSNPKIFVFILSTRSGGVGMNLTGADTVIFYDSDWNPAMDAQAQDRCHRIGQTREVHIYRLVSEKTIEENILTKSDQKRQLDHLAIQSGGFNTEFLQKFNPRELLGVQPGGGDKAQAAPVAAAATAAGSGNAGLSAEEMQAAMRSVEDETDAAAAAALEQENAAELAEFTIEPAARSAAEAGAGDGGDEGEEEDADVDDAKETTDTKSREPSIPASTSTGPDPDKPPAHSESALVPLARAEEDDEMMEDVAEMAGGRQMSGQDALANLEVTLKPVEKYAVRFLEEVQQQTEEENAAAEAEQLHLQEAEWNMADLERIQEQQEADMDEEGDAERAAQWDLAAADAAYKAQVEAALAQQRAVEEEHRLLLEQLEQQAAAAAAARARAEEEQKAVRPQRKPAARPVRTRAATPSSDSEEVEFDSPYARYRGSRWSNKRVLDEDRPLGRGMRIKQEPAHIQDPSMLTGSDPLSPTASNKRRRTQFTSSGPSRLSRPARVSGDRAHPSQGAAESGGGGGGRTPARTPRRLPSNIYSHAPAAALTARGAPVQIWQPWEAAEDLVLCAMVRSALTAALSLPVSAAPLGTTPIHPQARTNPFPTPHNASGTVIPPNQAGRQQPPRPQHPHTAQLAKGPPTLPTAAPAQHAQHGPPPGTSTPATHGTGANHPSPAAAPPTAVAPTSTSLAAASGGSLAALIGLPLPTLPDTAQPLLSISAATVSDAAVPPPLPAPAAPTPSVPQPLTKVPAASPTAPTTTAAAASISGHHLLSTAAPQPARAALPSPQQPVQATVKPQAINPLHAAPVSGLPSTAAQPVVAQQLPYSSAQQQQLQAPALAAAGQAPPASGGQASLGGGQASLASGGQAPASGGQALAGGGQASASGGQHARPGVPAVVVPGGAGQQGAAGQGRASSGQSQVLVGDAVWQLASDVMAAGGTATTAAAVTTAAQQAKKRSASDCRARFLMLMRARQAASAPQKLHRPSAPPAPAAARPSPLHAASAAPPLMPPGLSNPATAPAAALVSSAQLSHPVTAPAAALMSSAQLSHPATAPAAALMSSAQHSKAATAPAAQPQPIPAASRHIAAALAAQPTQAAPIATATAPALQPAVAPASLGMLTAGAGHVSFIPQLSQLQGTVQVPRSLTVQQGSQGVAVAPTHQHAATIGNSVAAAGLHTSTQPSSLPASAPTVAAPRRPFSALASIMPGQPATAAAYAPAAVVADTASVAGSGRGLRPVHEASLDVLQLKLRLVDLVQGCPALHPKELSNAFSQATAAAAAESQPASSKPPSPQVTHQPHPSAAATPTGTGQPLHAQPRPAQPHSLSTQAPQSLSQPQTGTQTPSLAQSQQQLPAQPSVVSSQAQPALPSSLHPAEQRAIPASAALPVGQRSFPQSVPAPVQPPALPTPLTGGYPPLAPLVIPSVVSGAQKTVKDLEQMATADAEAIIDAIEELVQDTSHGSATAADSRLADPVLSKSGQPLMQGGKAVAGDVEVGLQEAVEILNAATKGCGSYAKPILRHITTVADVAKRGGVQAANEALLKLLQIPKAVPQHALPQQQQQQLARPANMAPNQPPAAAASLSSKAGAGQQLPSGALQVQQQQQQHRPQQQLLHQQHQLQLQQQAQAAQLWQLRQGLANAAAALPSGVSFLQSPGASLGLQPTTASLGPLAAQISAASASGIGQVPAQPENRPLNLSASLASLPGNVVIPGLPVTAPVVPRTSASADDISTHRQANGSAN